MAVGQEEGREAPTAAAVPRGWARGAEAVVRAGRWSRRGSSADGQSAPPQVFFHFFRAAFPQAAHPERAGRNGRRRRRRGDGSGPILPLPLAALDLRPARAPGVASSGDSGEDDGKCETTNANELYAKRASNQNSSSLTVRHYAAKSIAAAVRETEPGAKRRCNSAEQTKNRKTARLWARRINLTNVSCAKLVFNRSCLTHLRIFASSASSVGPVSCLRTDLACASFALRASARMHTAI